jgi:hypothetical protein
MLNLFVYKSKIEFPVDVPTETANENFLQEMKKWLSKRSGQDADREGNRITFDVNPLGIGLIFVGINDGELATEILEDKLIVHYELSFWFPLLPLILADLVIYVLSFVKSDHPEYLFIAFVGSYLLAGLIIILFLTIYSFRDTIRQKWMEACSASVSFKL